MERNRTNAKNSIELFYNNNSDGNCPTNSSQSDTLQVNSPILVKHTD